MKRATRRSRRRVLRAAAYSPALLIPWADSAQATSETPTRAPIIRATPLPLESVRLTASPFLDAVEANRRYLLELEPDRLLHNFRTNSGLKPKGEIYGGWESESLAGHTLGHYLSACSLMYAQVGESECRRRVDYIVGELRLCQQASGDGYVSAFTRKNGEAIENGKAIFPELMRGEIRSAPFNLNGVWSPLYTVHKLLAGLLDAERYCGNTGARPIAIGMSAYLDRVFAHLSDAQVERVLETEFGGVTESFAELSARTGDDRWLKLAGRLTHHRILDPLADGRDELDGVHSNTQIPKLISEARLYELTGEERRARTARFFWQSVTSNRSYAIGGNSDRENFERPLSKYLTEQTCETCNTHNMLKLTRHLYAWQPDAAWFDFYERAHFNHILAHHDPASGMFTYMMPLISGARREFSSRTNDFWCCVGTGLESHSKHGDSIYWQSGDRLNVNLYIPSTLEWRERRVKFALETQYPQSERVAFTVTEVARPQALTLALRIPGWCKQARVAVNGKPLTVAPQNGYTVLRRRWKTGDRIELTLPMAVRTEPLHDDPNVVAFLRGPLVLAADLGPVSEEYSALAPGWVGDQPIASLKPFFQLYQRRAALYFQRYTPQEWEAASRAFAAELKRMQTLDASAIDLVNLGVTASEEAHGLTGPSETIVYRGRDSRLARKGGWIEFRLKAGAGPQTLQAVLRGDERKRRFCVLVDGTAIATQRLDGERGARFFDQAYPIPEELTRGKSAVTVRIEADPDFSTGPLYTWRMLGEAAVSAASA